MGREAGRANNAALFPASRRSTGPAPARTGKLYTLLRGRSIVSAIAHLGSGPQFQGMREIARHTAPKIHVGTAGHIAYKKLVIAYILGMLAFASLYMLPPVWRTYSAAGSATLPVVWAQLQPNATGALDLPHVSRDQFRRHPQ